MTAILDKIRKLLALSKSDNANEAAAAAAAAQKLMTEHQIAEAELTGEAEEKAQREVDPLFTSGSKMPAWLDVLSCGVCQQNGVFSYLARDRRGAPRRVMLIGRPGDVASVRYLFAWLRLEIERLTKRNVAGQGRTAVTSYRMGCVTGVLEAMSATVKVARQQATGSALVRLDARADEARELAPDGLRARGTTPLRDASAFRSGQADGRLIHTGGKLGASTGARLLGGGT